NEIPLPWRTELDQLRPSTADQLIVACDRILSNWSFDTDFIRVAVAPMIPHHCSDPLLRRLGDLARDYETSLHVHLAESKVQAVAGITLYGETLTAHLDRIGLINDRFIAGHAVWLDDDDMRRLAAHGAMVAHNPSSNLRLGSGLAAVGRLRELGVTVG